MHDRLKHLVHALTSLRAYGDCICRVQANSLLNRLLRAQNVGRGQIDLIDDRNDLQAVIDGEIGVGQCLRFHSLACVHYQQCALARGQRARNFVAEVHVARSIDQVELIGVAVVGFVHHAHGVSFDRDAALALQIHVVKDLRLHLTAGH